MEDSLLDKCLEFTRDVFMHEQPFSLNLKLSSGFYFNFDYHGKKKSTLLEESNCQGRTKVDVMETKKKKSPSTRKRNAKRMEDFVSKKSNMLENKVASSEVADEITKAKTNKEGGMYQCDKCTNQDKSNYKLQEHIATKYQNIKMFECEKCSRDSPVVPEVHNHIETEHDSECGNNICQELRNLLKDPDLCFCEWDPLFLSGHDMAAQHDLPGVTLSG